MIFFFLRYTYYFSQLLFISETEYFLLNNCLELEKEIEELKSNSVAGGTDEIIKVMKQF